MKLTKEQYDALPAFLKPFFKVSGDGYEGEIISQEDSEKAISGLKSKNEELLGKLKASGDKVTELEAANHELTVAATKGNGNTEALENSYKSRIEKMEKEHKSHLDLLNGEINSMTVGAAAEKLASDLFGKQAKLLIHHVNGRLASEVSKDGKRSIRVLDKDGNPTSLTVDDLAKEFRESEDFKSAVVQPPSGTKAPGIKPDLTPNPTAPVGGSDEIFKSALAIAQGVQG